MDYLDHRIKKVLIPNKGYGLIANEFIKAGEIIIKETPTITIQDKIIYSEIFQLLYLILRHPTESKKFTNLSPQTLKNISISKKEIFQELNKLHKKVYDFFITKYSIEEIMLFCAKYNCNAFQFQGKPVILFTGTILNHSCLPNVIFGQKDDKMCFMAIRDIQKDEEVCDNYIDITLNKKKRLIELKEQYGFDCQCERCVEKDDDKIKKLNMEAIEIERERKKEFGFSKSKFV